MSQLASQLQDGPPAARPTALDAFKAARRAFIAGERIEMQALAAQLGVSRVTLHRWVGNRDLLLGEILWSLARPTLRDARAATHARGADGIAEMVTRYIEAIRAAEFMLTFVQREPEIALRVMTTKRTPLQRRVAGALRDILAEEVEAGRLDPPMDLDDLAYVIGRIGEAFCYTDMITGEQPDPDKARKAITALLSTTSTGS